jgi:hypothetical protein
MPIEYTLVVIARALIEVAAYLMMGQAILFVLAGSRREGNFVYQLLRKGATPVYRFTRLITPRIILDKHIPFVAFLLLVWLWLALAYAKRAICVAQQLQCAL